MGIGNAPHLASRLSSLKNSTKGKMMNFTLEEIYNCSRSEFCERTGTSMEEMRDRLKKEVSVLMESFCHHHEIFRNGGSITDDGQRQLLRLLNTIGDKIQSKRAKILDIEKRLES